MSKLKIHQPLWQRRPYAFRRQTLKIIDRVNGTHHYKRNSDIKHTPSLDILELLMGADFKNTQLINK